MTFLPPGAEQASVDDDGLTGPPVEVKSVLDINNPEDLLSYCYPAFGASYVRRIFKISTVPSVKASRSSSRSQDLLPSQISIVLG